MKAHKDALATRLLAIVNRRIVAHLSKQPKAYSAFIIPDTWNPADGTVQVRVKHTAWLAAAGDGVNIPLDPIRVPLLTSALGHQYGPRGYEDVSLIPRADRYVAIFEHTADTTPQAPAGENWLVHFSSTAVIDLWIKLTNALGINVLAGPAFHVATAPNGVILDMNDSTGITQIGATGLDATLDAVATVRYVREYVDAVFNAHVHAGVQTGSGSTAPPNTSMQTHGSTTVRAKP